MPKSIDDIIPPSRRRMMDAQKVSHLQTASSSELPPSHTPISNDIPPALPPRMNIKTGRSFPYGTAIIAVLVIALSAGALYVFSGAKVEITPNTQATTVNGDFTATSGSGGDLSYSVVTVTKTESAAVPAESTETANDSSQGTITISNAQTTAQTLINNTRFQSPGGLIYHIHAPVSIPAASAGGTPGTVTAMVYADKPGQEYNIAPTTFTVPGLQGSASYALVTAKSSAPMLGGYSGTRASVSSATDSREQSTIQASLASTLQASLISETPSGYVIIPGATFTNYQALPDSASTTSSVLVSEQGTLTAVAFPEDQLAKAIAYKSVGTYSGEPVTLANFSKLSLTPSTQPASTTAASDIASSGTFAFTISGDTTILWKVDATKIAAAVAGKTRDSAQQILSGFPEVDKAVLILRPFWTSKFPSDPSHIQVTVTTPPASS